VIQQDSVEIKLIDQFQKRALQLQRFLKYVCRHTKLREDIHVVVFLEYAEELRPVSTASWFDRFSAPKIAVLPTDDQAGELCTAFAWAASYKNTLGPVISAADELAYFWRLLAVRERELAMDLHHFREIPGAGKALEMLARGLGKSQLQHHLRAQIADLMYDLLLDYTGIVVATQNMFGRRHDCYLRQLAATKVVKTKQQALKGTDPTRASHPAALQAHTDAAAKLAEATEQLESVSDTAVAEIRIAKKRRAADFRAAFVKLAEHEVYQGKQRQGEWAGVLEELEELYAVCVDPDAVEFDDNFKPPRRK